MSVTQKVTLYNNKFTVPPVINAVQNDTDRLIEAYFGDFTLQVGMTGVLSFIRSDRTHYEVSATLDTATNTATVELDQALTQAGVTQAQLKITDSGNVGSTFTFMIKVQPDVAGISVPQDGWSAQEFDQRLTDAENAIDAVEEDVADLQDKEYDYAPVITDTASGAIASFPDGADSYPLKECVVNIEAVQSGSGDPSPTNVRPISGWSEAKVTRCGKNFLALPVYYRADTSVPQMFFVKAGTYHLSFDIQNATSWRIGLWLRDKDGNNLSDYAYRPDGNFSWYVNPGYWMQGANGVLKSVNIKIVEDCYVRFFVGIGDTSSSTTTSNGQLELGSTATDYEPYNGTSVTIDLGSTRYGCALDVRRGKLRVTKAYRAVSSTDSTRLFSQAVTTGVCRIGIVVNDMKPPTWNVQSEELDTICNIAYPDTAPVHSTSSTAIYQCVLYKDGSYPLFVITLPNQSISSASDALQMLVSLGCAFVYPLATPIEVDLTPTEITTLLGTNNIFADTGDIEVEYCADTKRWILKKIAEAVA